jgi:putative ABC transport system ATP-binding protein
VLRRAVVRHLRWLAPSTVLTMLRQLGEISLPVLIGYTIDRAVATGNLSALVGLMALLAALFGGQYLAYRIGVRMGVIAITRESYLLGVELGHKVLHPLGVRTEFKGGELLSVLTSDARQSAYILDDVSRVAGATVAIIACSAVLISISPSLGVMVLIGVPAVVAGLQLTAPKIARRVADQQAEIGLAVALAADLINGHRPLRGIGAQGIAAARYRTASRRSLAASLRACRLQSAYEGVASAAAALAAVGVAMAATYLAMDGSLSIGELISVIGLAGFLIEPFGILTNVPSSVAKARASASRLARLLNAPTRDEPPTPVPAPAGVAAGTLTISGVTHAGLDGVSLDVGPGELVAVLVTDARHATALIELLSGRVRCEESGTVRVGGRRINEIPLGERHTKLLVEHHHSDLFSGTLGSNLRMGDDSNTRIVLEASCAVDVVELHPDGLAHPISDRGASLSGGQRQRWALARALAVDPEVLVLHDPTTSVDAVTEQAIADGIRRLRVGGGRTTVILTSSPALLAAADRVVLITDGRVRGEGTHREMVSTYSEYRERVQR